MGKYNTMEFSEHVTAEPKEGIGNTPAGFVAYDMNTDGDVTAPVRSPDGSAEGDAAEFDELADIDDWLDQADLPRVEDGDQAAETTAPYVGSVAAAHAADITPVTDRGNGNQTPPRSQQPPTKSSPEQEEAGAPSASSAGPPLPPPPTDRPVPTPGEGDENHPEGSGESKDTPAEVQATSVAETAPAVTATSLNEALTTRLLSAPHVGDQHRVRGETTYTDSRGNEVVITYSFSNYHAFLSNKFGGEVGGSPVAQREITAAHQGVIDLEITRGGLGEHGETIGSYTLFKGKDADEGNNLGFVTYVGRDSIGDRLQRPDRTPSGEPWPEDPRDWPDEPVVMSETSTPEGADRKILANPAADPLLQAVYKDTSKVPEVAADPRQRAAQAQEILAVAEDRRRSHPGDMVNRKNFDDVYTPARATDIVPVLEAANLQPGKRFVAIVGGDGRWTTIAAAVYGQQAHDYESSRNRCTVATEITRDLQERNIISSDAARRTIHFSPQPDLGYAYDISTASTILVHEGFGPAMSDVEQEILRYAPADAQIIVYDEKDGFANLERVVGNILGNGTPVSMYRLPRPAPESVPPEQAPTQEVRTRRRPGETMAAVTMLYRAHIELGTDLTQVLTRLQREILPLLAQGLKPKEIAESLDTSVSVVNTLAGRAIPMLMEGVPQEVLDQLPQPQPHVVAERAEDTAGAQLKAYIHGAGLIYENVATAGRTVKSLIRMLHGQTYPPEEYFNAVVDSVPMSPDEADRLKELYHQEREAELVRRQKQGVESRAEATTDATRTGSRGADQADIANLDSSRRNRPLLNLEINVPRLLADLEVSTADLQAIAALHIPSNIGGVSSLSGIKITTVADGLYIAYPERNFTVQGSKAPSGVNEQPIGQQAIDGALRRLSNLVALREAADPGSSETRTDFSLENGLFRVSRQPGVMQPTDRSAEGIIQFTEQADLTTDFDPNAEYEDRAVVAIRIPGQPIIVQVSPSSEAVRFPMEAVLAAAQAEGGLAQHTAGSKLAEMGLVADKQNPHTELTADRPGGPLPRQDQMARIIIRGLLRLARRSDR